MVSSRNKVDTCYLWEAEETERLAFHGRIDCYQEIYHQLWQVVPRADFLILC